MDLLTSEVDAKSPDLTAGTVKSSAAIVGDAAWLMMESPWHRGRSVQDFHRLVMPPIKLRQFRIFYDANRPIGFLSWALLSSEAETRYFDNPYLLQPRDWSSGAMAYVVDFVLSRGAIRRVLPYLRRDPLISNTPVRALKIRNNVRVVVEITAKSGQARVGAFRVGQRQA